MYSQGLYDYFDVFVDNNQWQVYHITPNSQRKSYQNGKALAYNQYETAKSVAESMNTIYNKIKPKN